MIRQESNLSHDTCMWSLDVTATGCVDLPNGTCTRTQVVVGRGSSFGCEAGRRRHIEKHPEVSHSRRHRQGGRNVSLGRLGPPTST